MKGSGGRGGGICSDAVNEDGGNGPPEAVRLARRWRSVSYRQAMICSSFRRRQTRIRILFIEVVSSYSLISPSPPPPPHPPEPLHSPLLPLHSPPPPIPTLSPEKCCFLCLARYGGGGGGAVREGGTNGGCRDVDKRCQTLASEAEKTTTTTTNKKQKKNNNNKTI